MSEIAIRCDGLAKQYQIGEREKYKTLRESIAGALVSPFRRARSALQRPFGDGHQNPATIWALQDVSLEIHRGEAVGIIGRNGAGKSHIAKDPFPHHRAYAWSRRYLRTRGVAAGSRHGISSGTDRPGEYLPQRRDTGHDARRRSIRKFDEIVAFAEVEKFIDTPVKRYSSGMYVRLAFAVAAHLEPEILIVDEVLAVGDTQFQKKCLGKMGDVARDGRTVLLVSHNMAAIHSLCGRAILLEQGRDVSDGKPLNVTRLYLSGFEKQITGGVVDLQSPAISRSGKASIFSALRLKNGAGATTAAYLSGDNMMVELDLDPPFPVQAPILFVAIDDIMGRRIFTISSQYSQSKLPALERPTTVVCTIPDLCLQPGRYSMSLCVGTAYDWNLDLLLNVASFDVHESDYFGTGRVPPNQDFGSVLVRSQWQIDGLGKQA